MPRPDDLGRAPLWDLYVNRQLVQASLGRLPVQLRALGVQIDALKVVLHFQLSELTQAAMEDIDEIQQDLDMLTGFVLDIDRVIEVKAERDGSGSTGIWWVYLDRPPGNDAGADSSIERHAR